MLRIAVGVSGASGSIYAKRLLDRLQSCKDQWESVGVVFSTNGLANWKLEMGRFDASQYPYDFYKAQDFGAPFASGSAKYDVMIICPCSMGVLGRVAQGTSPDLITRAADVMLKERRRLILVPRETPLSLIHLRNMVAVTEAGAIICPAIPSLYSRPNTVVEMVDTVVSRVLDLAGLDIDAYRWGQDAKPS